MSNTETPEKIRDAKIEEARQACLVPLKRAIITHTNKVKSAQANYLKAWKGAWIDYFSSLKQDKNIEFLKETQWGVYVLGNKTKIITDFLGNETWVAQVTHDSILKFTTPLFPTEVMAYHYAIQFVRDNNL